MDEAIGHQVIDVQAVVVTCWQRLRSIVLREEGVAPAFRMTLPSVADAEDFIQDQIESIVGKLTEGPPPGFDASLGELASYLTARELLLLKAIDFAERRRRGRAWTQLDEIAEPAAAISSAGGHAPDVLRRPLRLTWPNGTCGVVYVMAAVQLWTRLDQDQPAMPAIRAALAERIDGSDWVDRLEKEHRAAAKALAQERRELDAARGPLETPRGRRRYEARIAALERRGFVQPLERVALGRLLGLKSDAAHKQLERYRVALPTLIVGLEALVPRPDGEDPDG